MASTLDSHALHAPPTPKSENEKSVASLQNEVAEQGHGETDIPLDPAAEARLRRKIDLYIIPTVAILYLFCFIDRANIGNARLAGLEKDLGMTGYDYNAVLSIFYISYILFEIPSNMACKWIGPGWFIPAISLGFGIASIGTAFVTNKHSISGVRFILGLFEAGMLPGIAYYMSRWYRRAELAFRLSIYIVMAPLAGAFGGLLASAILTLDSFGGLTHWRMIFAIEGIVTCCLSLLAFFTLTDRPETARWLSPAEKHLATTRIQSERLTPTSKVLDTLSRTKTLRGIFNPVVLTTALIFLLDNITVQGLAFFAPTIVRSIYPDQSTVYLQLRTVPPYIVGAVFTLALPYLSSRIDARTPVMLICAPLMIAGYIMFLAASSPTVRYAASFVIASGAFAFGALCNAHASANVVSDCARASAIGTVVMLGNVGGLISTWSFLPGDAPHFVKGNALNLGTSACVLGVSAGMWAWMRWDNQRRDRVVVGTEHGHGDAGETGEEGAEALEWRHSGFRWRY